MTPSWRPACPGIGEAMVCVLLFSGLCSSLYEYHFIDEPKDWDQAKSHCIKQQKKLASIGDMEDMRRLTAAVGSGFEGKVWFGLYDSSSNWLWSKYDANGSVEMKTIFRSWHSGQPNDIRVQGKLCVAFQQGTWYDFDFETKFPFVCYNGDLSSSSLGYVVIDQEMNWKKAQIYCRTNHLDLAIVRSDHDNSELQQLVGDDRFVWIGLFRYTWSMWVGDKSKFQNWVNGHPKNVSESCATSVFDADHAGEWEETRCHEKHPFVCYNEVDVPTLPPVKKKMFRIKMTVLKSTIDLNDPAVTEALLNKIKERMREKGITTDFKVSWIKKSNGKIFNEEKKSVKEAQGCQP